jgi:hypothetical protein
VIFSVLLSVGLLLLNCRSQQPQLSSEMLTAHQKELAAQLHDVTTNYVDKTIGVASFGGKPFCAYRILDVEESGDNINEYVFAICQEYYLKDNTKLAKGTGVSLPVALNIGKRDGAFRILGHQEPADGDRYSVDVQRIFPKKTHYEILQAINYGEGARMQSSIETDARNYYRGNSNAGP